MRLLRRKKEPARLKKKTSYKEKIQKWMEKNYMYLVIVGMGVTFVLLVYLCIRFAPGTESGLWYNNRTGVA